MRDSSKARAGVKARPRSHGLSFADEARFIRTWLKNPKLTGAVSPSGRFLAKAMARSVDPRKPGVVVELGPGTGPVTNALIERGIPQERLVLVEFDARFCALLRQRFPRARIVQGDAYRLAETLAGVVNEPIQAVVSSLPLLNQSAPMRLDLVEEALTMMQAGGVFVQFTYGMVSPIPSHNGSFRFSASAARPVWLNMPPARVWTYRLDSNAPVTAPILTRLRECADQIGDDWSERAGLAGRVIRDRRVAFSDRMRAGANKIVAKARRRAPGLFGRRDCD